jgi:hypothetical protein
MIKVHVQTICEFCDGEASTPVDMILILKVSNSFVIRHAYQQ